MDWAGRGRRVGQDGRTSWIFNIAMVTIPTLNGGFYGKIIYFYGPFSMAMWKKTDGIRVYNVAMDNRIKSTSDFSRLGHGRDTFKLITTSIS